MKTDSINPPLQFSTRTFWSNQSNPLSLAIANRKSLPSTLIDLTESNPTKALVSTHDPCIFAPPQMSAYQPHPLGLDSAREAIANYYKERNLLAPVERILITASTSEAYSFLFKLLTNPGEEILVPAPSYPLLEWLAKLELVRLVTYPLLYDGEWHFAQDLLERSISPRTRAIVAVHPNHPTGSYIKLNELSYLTNLCQKYGIALICDEVFADYSLSSELSHSPRARSALQQTEILSFSLSGLSKVALLPQWKIAWMVVTGPQNLVEKSMQKLEMISDTFLSANTPAQLALKAILGQYQSIQAPLINRLQHNLHILHRLHKPTSAWQPLRVEGGWNAIIRLPRILSELEWCLKFLDYDDVLVYPGFYFDFLQEGFIVLSLLVESSLFQEAVRRIDQRIEQING